MWGETAPSGPENLPVKHPSSMRPPRQAPSRAEYLPVWRETAQIAIRVAKTAQLGSCGWYRVTGYPCLKMQKCRTLPYKTAKRAFFTTGIENVLPNAVSPQQCAEGIYVRRGGKGERSESFPSTPPTPSVDIAGVG